VSLYSLGPFASAIIEDSRFEASNGIINVQKSKFFKGANNLHDRMYLQFKSDIVKSRRRLWNVIAG
jgi:hypothetical protein